MFSSVGQGRLFRGRKVVSSTDRTEYSTIIYNGGVRLRRRLVVKDRGCGALRNSNKKIVLKECSKKRKLLSKVVKVREALLEALGKVK